jgi:hypothetical protein
VGRAPTEALRGHERDPVPAAVPNIRGSRPSLMGLRTILRTQVLQGAYYDAAGFPGRTLGLVGALRGCALQHSRIAVAPRSPRGTV